MGKTTNPPQVHAHHQTWVEVLDQAPLSAFHYRLWILATAGPLLSGVSMMLLGIVLPLLRADFRLHPSTMGLIAACLMGGTILGALLSGHLADRFGRRPLLLANAAGLVLAGFLLSLVEGSLGLGIGELLLGIAIGGDFPVGSSFISEFMPQSHRGRMLAGAMALQPLGMLVAAAIALALLGSGQQSWRYLMAVQALFGIPYFLGRWTLPESIRWLIAHGRNHDAAQVLTRIVPEQQERWQRMAKELGRTMHQASKLRSIPHNRWLVLLAPEYRRRTILVTIPWFLMDMATYGIGLFTPLLLSEILPHTTFTAAWQRDWIDTLNSLRVNGFLLLGALLALFLIPRLGRIRMQILGFLGMGLGLLLLWASLWLHGDALLLLAAFAFYNLVMTAGPNATTFILPTEMYPTQVRGIGSGFAAAFAKLGATLAVFLLPILQEHLGSGAVIALMAALSAAAALLTFAFRVEGQGLSLEQHQGLQPLRVRKIHEAGR
jgi:MFS family permease